MEDLDFNWTSWENSLNHSNMSFNTSERINYTHLTNDVFSDIFTWVNCITIAIGLPLTLVVIVAVCSQVKKDHGAPVYVINLLISDLIQFSCRILLNFQKTYWVSMFILIPSLLASIGFMMCISFERYLVIACPMWYRFRRNLKTSVLVSIVVWISALLYLPLTMFVSETAHVIVLYIFLLLPFPLFIFFLVGSIKALSGAHSVTADEKRRIVAIQFVVLLIYSLLYLPQFFTTLDKYEIIPILAVVCVFISPLADATLYLFIRKSVLDNFLSSLCSCKTSNNQEMSSMGTQSVTAPSTETV